MDNTKGITYENYVRQFNSGSVDKETLEFHAAETAKVIKKLKEELEEQLKVKGYIDRKIEKYSSDVAEKSIERRIIDVSESEYRFLKKMSSELNSQSNRGTANPYLYVILEKVNIPVPDGCGEEKIVGPEGGLYEINDLAEEVADYLGLSTVQIDEKDIRDFVNSDRSEYFFRDFAEDNVCRICSHFNGAFFFTEEACHEHIRANMHHYHDPKSYVIHASRNPELLNVINIMKGISCEQKPYLAYEKNGRITSIAINFRNYRDFLEEFMFSSSYAPRFLNDSIGDYKDWVMKRLSDGEIERRVEDSGLKILKSQKKFKWGGRVL